MAITNKTVSVKLGSGLEFEPDGDSTQKIAVNVDNSTIEAGANGLQIKANGITSAQLADGAVTIDKIANDAKQTAAVSADNTDDTKLVTAGSLGLTRKALETSIDTKMATNEWTVEEGTGSSATRKLNGALLASRTVALGSLADDVQTKITNAVQGIAGDGGYLTLDSTSRIITANKITDANIADDAAIATGKLAINTGTTNNVLYYGNDGKLTSGLLTSSNLSATAGILKTQLAEDVRNEITNNTNRLAGIANDSTVVDYVYNNAQNAAYGTSTIKATLDTLVGGGSGSIADAIAKNNAKLLGTGEEPISIAHALGATDATTLKEQVCHPTT